MGDFVIADALLFLDALICGMIIGGIYDVIRIFRRVILHYRLFVDVEDFLFWNIAGIYVFAVMFSENNGIIRGFFIIGIIIGALIYKKSIGEILVEYVSRAINCIANIILKKPISKVIMIIEERKEKADGRSANERTKSCKNNSDNKEKAVK